MITVNNRSRFPSLKEENIRVTNAFYVNQGLECTLIITQDDSIRSLIINCHQTVGLGFVGLFNFQEKPLNVKQATRKKFLEGIDYQVLMSTLGLI